MRPDRGATDASRRDFAERGAASTLRRSIQAGPIFIVPRQLDPAIAVALDGMVADDLPRFDVSGPVERVESAVEAALCCKQPPAVFAWLPLDITALIGLFARATGSRAVRARLHVVQDDMCRTFHVDNVAFRLLTSYRGPGTQWLLPGRAADAPLGQPIGRDAIRELPRGHVAILRGGKAATPDQPGVLHRSPPIDGTGLLRLLLAVNEVAH